jgi:hypothetical protein
MRAVRKDKEIDENRMLWSMDLRFMTCPYRTEIGTDQGVSTFEPIIGFWKKGVKKIKISSAINADATTTTLLYFFS